MAKYLGKKIIISVITLFVILLILFLLLQFMPGSPFNDAKLSEKQVAMLRTRYGLDKPVIERFFNYIGNMFCGDLGVSYSVSVNTPITDLIANRFPVTMEIGLTSLVIGTFLGCALGLVTAFFRNKVLKVIYTILTLIGFAVPSYILAMFFSYVFGFREIMPNIIGKMITQIMISIPTAIFLEAFLSFTGLGMPPGSCSLGTLLSEGFRTVLLHPFQLVPPAVLMILMIVGSHLVAQGLKKATE